MSESAGDGMKIVWWMFNIVGGFLLLLISTYVKSLIKKIEDTFVTANSTNTAVAVLSERTATVERSIVKFQELFSTIEQRCAKLDVRITIVESKNESE